MKYAQDELGEPHSEQNSLLPEIDICKKKVKELCL